MNPVLLKSGHEFDRELGDESLALLGPEYCEEVIENLYRHDDKKAKAHLMEMQMARIAQGAAKVEFKIDEEALGVPDYRVCKAAYHAWAWKFRDENDNPRYDCWDDDEFIADMKRDNPEMRLRVAKNMNRVGWTPEKVWSGECGVRNGESAVPVNKITLTDSDMDAPPPPIENYHKLPPNVVVGEFQSRDLASRAP